jgi:serine/threonine protein kinase
MQEFEISLLSNDGAAMNEASPASSPSEPHALEVGAGQDRRIGQVIDGKYHVLRRLACGGMGSVYEARHVVVGRHLALKFLHEQYAQRSCMVQRFLREAQAAGGIASEHIISVLDYGTTDGTPYLVMELVRGKDLREILAETPRLLPARAVRIVLDACRGLSLAHERGLVHRDLKPANICVTRGSDGREVAKVIDFGVAKLRDGAELSEEGTLIGTLGYMAPEQLTDQRELDARADIYALGVILYQAISGRPPHLCSRSELLYRIVSVDPKPLHELCPELPHGLAAVVHKALCRNKERRYASVRLFAQALEPFAGDDSASTATLLARTESLGRREASEYREGLADDAVPAQTGTEETELGNAPTWAALARANNLKADRQCEGVNVLRGARGSVEEYCRHPDGLPPPPPPTRHQHLSQRALLLSVGALALSVVAMTTMFVFVYSHGSGALEAAAKAARPQPRAVAEAQAPGSSSSSPVTNGPPRGPAGADLPTASSAAPFARTALPDRCVSATHPLHPASVIEFGAEEGGGIRVERHALMPSIGAHAIECE